MMIIPSNSLHLLLAILEFSDVPISLILIATVSPNLLVALMLEVHTCMYSKLATYVNPKDFPNVF